MRPTIRAPKILLGAYLFLAALGAGFADGLPDTLALSFRRETVKDGKAETLAATAYYRAAPHFFCLEVTEPLRQLIFYTPKYTLVYYPDSSKAIRIGNAGGKNDSEERGIAVLFSRDKGLAASGYRMDTIVPAKDGAESVWVPPKSIADAVRNVRVTTDAADRILSMTTASSAGIVVQETTYDRYGEKMAGLPAAVTTRVFKGDGSVAVETRLLVLSAAASPVPERLLNFKVPDGTQTEELSW